MAVLPVALAVLVLPLDAEGSITLKQAAGTTFQMRDALERGGFAKVLSTSKDDAKDAEKCALDASCLAELAGVRGADVVVAGQVAPAPDGVLLTVVSAGPGVPEGHRKFSRTLHGDDDDARTLDRLVRELVDPRALLGSVFVEGGEGDAGALVVLDGEELGTLPLKQQKNGVVEGFHTVTVTRDGALLWERQINVVYAETTIVRAVLTEPAPEEAKPLPIVPLVVSGAGVALVAGGVVCGVFALLASMEVEARAKEQQLLFPRDEALLFRGTVLAWSANGLYLAGAAAIATGAVLFVVAE